MRILITGSAGFIGSALYEFLKKDFEVCGVDIAKSSTVDSVLDISSKDSLRDKLNNFKPKIIIHLSAVKSLIKCEQDKLSAWKTNVESTAEIVQYAYCNAVKVIYVSSDMVFDGLKGNYRETDLPNPVNWYGVTKHHSELLVKQLSNSVICRTAFVLGNLREVDKISLREESNSAILDNQSLFPYYVIERAKQNKIIKLSDTVISSPSPISLLQLSIKKIVDDDLSGTYHLASHEAISRYRFAVKIAEFCKLDTSLITSDESSVLAIRPKDLSLNTDDTYIRLGLYASEWNIDSLIKGLDLITYRTA